MIVFDAENEVMGRVASVVAKEALQGNEVSVINCEKAFISGTKDNIVKEFKEIRALNLNRPEKGPFISKDSEKIMRRKIRAMLPDFRVGRGRDAWKKIRCYKGIPENMQKEKIIKIKSKIPKRHMTVGELSNFA
jgi:large subunit ribosomal protein L13